jgi:aryl-alcohol dehydrogenase-like predicted oxidoreductase
MSAPLTLDSYRLLGRSGLRVSPLALGTMTFGAAWGSEEAESRRIFDAYVDHGGNFIDTAGHYAQGRSETLTGQFARGKRERLVIATKYSLAVEPGDPNAAGNGRKSMMRSVEDSLKRLQTMAELRGWTQLAALQVEYSLLQRATERDLIPAACALGMGVMPWSPLAKQIADAMGISSAQAAIGWTLVNPAVTSTIIGARSLRQLNDNLGALQVSLDDEQKRQLDDLSRIELGFPHDFLNYEFIRQNLFAGTKVRLR